MLEMNKSKKYKEIHKRLINVSKKYKYKTIKIHKIY